MASMIDELLRLVDQEHEPEEKPEETPDGTLVIKPKKEENLQVKDVKRSEKVQKFLKLRPQFAAQSDENGYTLLHAACAWEKPTLMEDLVKVYKVDPNITDIFGETPLFHAECIWSASKMIELGADLKHLNSSNQTVLESAEEELDDGSIGLPLVAYYRRLFSGDAQAGAEELRKETADAQTKQEDLQTKEDTREKDSQTKEENIQKEESQMKEGDIQTEKDTQKEEKDVQMGESASILKDGLQELSQLSGLKLTLGTIYGDESPALDTEIREMIDKLAQEDVTPEQNQKIMQEIEARIRGMGLGQSDEREIKRRAE